MRHRRPQLNLKQAGVHTVWSGSTPRTFTRARYISSAVPSKNLPQPPTNRVSPARDHLKSQFLYGNLHVWWSRTGTVYIQIKVILLAFCFILQQIQYKFKYTQKVSLIARMLHKSIRQNAAIQWPPLSGEPKVSVMLTSEDDWTFLGVTTSDIVANVARRVTWSGQALDLQWPNLQHNKTTTN